MRRRCIQNRRVLTACIASILFFGICIASNVAQAENDGDSALRKSQHPGEDTWESFSADVLGVSQHLSGIGRIPFTTTQRDVDKINDFLTGLTRTVSRYGSSPVSRVREFTTRIIGDQVVGLAASFGDISVNHAIKLMGMLETYRHFGDALPQELAWAKKRCPEFAGVEARAPNIAIAPDLLVGFKFLLHEQLLKKTQGETNRVDGHASDGDRRAAHDLTTAVATDFKRAGDALPILKQVEKWRARKAARARVPRDLAHIVDTWANLQLERIPRIARRAMRSRDRILR